MDAARGYCDIGALEDFSITLLGESSITRRLPQLASGPPQGSSKDRSGYCSERNEPLAAIAAYEPVPARDRRFALAAGFRRIDDDPRAISQIPESELLDGFGA